MYIYTFVSGIWGKGMLYSLAQMGERVIYLNNVIASFGMSNNNAKPIRIFPKI